MEPAFFKPARAFIFIFAAAVFFSCTRAQPTVDFWTTRLVWQKADDGVIQTLIFFVIANDEDGADDIEELRLYHDDEGLMWRMTSDNWTRFDESGRTWIGNKTLRMPSGETFPSGQYRAVLTDKAGEQGEKIFGFEAPADSRYRFPTISIDGDNYSVTSEYPDNYILCYHNDGQFRNSLKLDAKSGNVTQLRLAADVSQIALWADDSSGMTAAVTPLINVR